MAGKPKKAKHTVMGVPNPEAVKAAMAQLGDMAKAAGLPVVPVATSPVESAEPEVVQEAATQGYTTVMHKDGAGETTTKAEDEIVKVEKFTEKPATVSVEMGVVLNLGQYESARITIGISKPCPPGEVDQAYEQAKTWVTDRLQKEVKEVRDTSAAKKAPY